MDTNTKGETLMRRVTVPAVLAFLAVASAAQAHPKLLAASPAANATVGRPGRVELRFSERLMPIFSGADLMMGMAGANRGSLKIASTAAVARDGRTLVITPKSPLAAGRYSVAWHVVSVDTHRVAGTYGFAVK